ncbi:MAG: hypothetical protein GC159_05325 [Phycisphaera sp.]|nr:hypothetical protein [Phycisphaera sp.]
MIRRTPMSTLKTLAAALAVVAIPAVVTAHDPVNKDQADDPQAVAEVTHIAVVAQADAKAGDAKPTTGQGAMIFSWDQGLTAAFPDDAKKFEPGMHGGFNEDPETGIVYTGIPGYGLCQISADLKTWKLLGDDPRLKGNIHGLVFFVHNGKKYIAVAQQGDQRVLVVDLDGKVLQQINKPAGGEFNFEPANAYYKGAKSPFNCTDVTYLDGRLYVVTGYSPGDFVLTATEKDGQWAWGPIAWGGKGDGPGQFKTAHGVFAHEGFIYVANREAHKVVKFTKDGELVEEIKDIPPGSRVCNIAYLADHFFFCPLAKIGNQKSAPIYAHTGEKLVSTIIPGDLGIPVLNNIHDAWPHYVTQADGSKELYILIHGWNKGKYAVLKHESSAAAAAALHGGLFAGVVPNADR